MLKYILPFPLAELFSNLKTLLRFILSFFWVLTYTQFLRCWAVPTPITLLRYFLSFYTAEPFPILKHWWQIPWIFTVLSYTNPDTLLRYTLTCYSDEPQFHCISELYPIFNTSFNKTLFYHLAELSPNNITLLRYMLIHHIAGLLPILKHFRRITCFLTCPQSYYFAGVYLVLLLCWTFSNIEA